MSNNLLIENLAISIQDTSKEMGKAAADFVERKLKEAIDAKGFANLILATGSSQFKFLDALKEKEINWQKITVFHLDEYKSISDTHPASFRRYLKERILDEVVPQKTFFLNGNADDIEQEMQQYAKELEKHPIDIACIGIGENGHIAFNDPGVANFEDPKLVKLVKLDQACRNQQVGEEWFSTLNDVPELALTLTITAILSCKAISCVVPDERKSQAVHDTLYHPISTSCPATILRKHPAVRIFLDPGSASRL